MRRIQPGVRFGIGYRVKEFNMSRLVIVFLLAVLAPFVYAQERYDLTTPITKTIATKWEYDGLSFSRVRGQFDVHFHDPGTGEWKTCSENDPVQARALINALNKADLRANSLGQRARDRYAGSGKCLGVGTPAGTAP